MKLQSRSQKIIDKLRKKGKVKSFSIPYSQEDAERMEKIMRECRRKQAASWLAAKDTILD